MDKINLLYIFMTLPVGGVEKHLVTVLKNIDLKRFNPVVCCIENEGVIGEQIKQIGCEVIALRNERRWWWDLRVVFPLARLIKEKKIHLVHSHLHQANLYGRIAACIAGVPVIAGIHNAYPRIILRQSVINWSLAKITEKFVVCTGAVKQDILRYDKVRSYKVVVIHYGVDCKRCDSPIAKTEAKRRIGVSEDTFTVGNVARLEPQKNHELLLEAADKVSRKIEGFKLLLVGSGSLEDQLKKKSQALGLSNKVLFLGEREDIPELLKAMDVFALSSSWEGLPNCVLEAMAAGVPIISTDVGGIREIISSQGLGIIVPSGDEKSLSEAIFLLYQDKEKRESLALKGKERVNSCFSHEIMMSQLTSVYESVLKERG